jgi:predicted Fe-S protein YdhL (DUF1289 family)
VNRSTPCVGICSTTYGDLVCRGCNRFAHEIVQWNGFNGDQQAAIWSRLHELREGAVANWLQVSDPDLLMQRAVLCELAGRDQVSTLQLAYEVLRSVDLPVTELAQIGIQTLARGKVDGWSYELVRDIDQEFYSRSLAHYEHNFKIAAQ